MSSAGYVWDGRGNLVSAIRTDTGLSPRSINAFTFDSLGDKIKETDNQLPVAWTRTAQYNGRGLLAKTTVNTTNWARTYDTLGRLARHQARHRRQPDRPLHLRRVRLPD